MYVYVTCYIHKHMHTYCTNTLLQYCSTIRSTVLPKTQKVIYIHSLSCVSIRIIRLLYIQEAFHDCEKVLKNCDLFSENKFDTWCISKDTSTTLSLCILHIHCSSVRWAELCKLIHVIPGNVVSTNHKLYTRDLPIMLKILPIMLCCTAQKLCLLFSNYAH